MEGGKPIRCHCNTHSPGKRMSHVGLWGNTRTSAVTQCLGLGVKPPKGYGLRKVIYDASFGYVSGYKIRDIAYYVLTRSLSRKVRDIALRLEQPKRDAEFREVSVKRGAALGMSVADLEQHVGKPVGAWTQADMSNLYLDMKTFDIFENEAGS